MIFVLTPKTPLTEYLFSGQENFSPIFYPQNMRYSLYDRLFIWCFRNISDKIFHNPFPFAVRKRLKDIGKYDKLVVIEEYAYLLKVVAWSCRHVSNRIIYFWNPLAHSCTIVGRTQLSGNNPYSRYIEYCKQLGYRLCSFDRQDSFKYGINFYPQFYKKVPIERMQFPQARFFFCGYEKDRKDTINLFRQLLDSVGECDFIVVEDGSTPISYLEYVHHLSEATALCEITQKGQCGLTQRTIESLFWKKKLITNNDKVKEYDFYRSKNILVVTKNTTSQDVITFLEIGYEDIPKDVIAEYDVETWADKV